MDAESQKQQIAAYKEYSKDAKVNGRTDNIKSIAGKKLSYPKRIFFIIASEFCEKFNYFGMKTILYIYMVEKIGLSANEATIQYHTFTTAVFVTCVFGAIVADVWLGAFWTIFWLSLVYAVGSSVLALGAIPHIGISMTGTLYAGLALICVGGGGIKPCVSALSGDQFVLPEQTEHMARYFSMFYFVLNAGALLSSALTPVLRANVHCFDQADCYPLAFGVPAILMLITIVLLVIGKPWYTMRPPQGNIIFDIVKCLANAIISKIRYRKVIPRAHFLDYSIDKYGQQLVDDTKTFLNIITLALPIPLFFAMAEQQGSRWVHQGIEMNGDIGFYTIKPDQMQLFHPLLVAAFVPTFDYGVYKLVHLSKLARIIIGGFLYAISFVIAAIVQLSIEQSGENQLHILWQIPQYIIVTAGDIMFAISGLAFAYEQSPNRMKSFVLSIWYLAGAFGNLIVTIIVRLNLFESMVYEYLLYAGLMTLTMLVYILVVKRFKNMHSNEQK